MKVKLGDREVEARMLLVLDLRDNQKVINELEAKEDFITRNATLLALACGLTVEEILRSFTYGEMDEMNAAVRAVTRRNGLERQEGAPLGETQSP